MNTARRRAGLGGANRDSVMRKKAAWEAKWVAKADRPIMRVEDRTPEIEAGGAVFPPE